MQTILNGLLGSSQSFVSTIRHMMKGNPNALTSEKLVSVLLQEEKSMQNKSIMRVVDRAFAANLIKAR